MYEGRFKYLDAGYLQEHDAVFDVEAGDVDGDGVDELFVYAGCYVDENGVRKAVVDMYDLEGGNWKQSVVKIDAGNAADYTTHNKGGNDSWTQLQSAPVVSLAAGDLDRDFCDDLAIVVSAPYGKKNIDKSTPLRAVFVGCIQGCARPCRCSGRRGRNLPLRERQDHGRCECDVRHVCRLR